MKTIKVCDSFDSELNWMVGIANGWLTYPTDSIERGLYFHINPAIAPLGYDHNKIMVSWYRPSSDWSHGGPIVDHMIDNGYEFKRGEFGTGVKVMRFPKGDTECQFGPTLLIAAMRCYVASKLGDKVEVPDELD